MIVKPEFTLSCLTATAAVRVLAAGLTLWNTAAGAEPVPYYVDGRLTPLERSDTELAIELFDGDSIFAADFGIRSRELGTVSALPWGRAERFGILTVPGVDAAIVKKASQAGWIKSVHPVYRFVAGGLPHLGTGRVAVKFFDPLATEEHSALLAKHHLCEHAPIAGVNGAYLVEALDTTQDEAVLAALLSAEPGVEFAQPDLISPLRLAQGGPIFDIANLTNDPLAPEQWHLQNSGQGGGVVGADINVVEAWVNGVFGTGVVVGMLDDACDLSHEYLAANYTSMSHNAATGQRSETAANPTALGHRHGTSMMGLICAESNSRGVAGVAPRSRFTVSAGADSALSASQIASAFDFAFDRGVDVHCNSWTAEAGAPISSTVETALNQVFTEGRDGLGMVLVFPAGNDSVEAAEGSSLAAARNNDGQKLAIGVSAFNARDRVVSYGNFGAGVDVLAPSGDVFQVPLVTTDNTDNVGLADPGYNSNGVDDFGQPNLSDPCYTRGDSFSAVDDPDFFGTSAAAAQVAGIAALVLNVSEEFGTPRPTATQVCAILEHTADKIPLADPDEGDYNVVTGRSARYGYGRVNAGAALSATIRMNPNSPFTWPERVKEVDVDTRDNVLSWEKNDDLRTVNGETFGDQSTDVLVVQRIGQDFEWTPEDGETYGVGLEVDSAQNVRVIHSGAADSVEFDDSRGVLYFGIFARNAAGRWSFGTSVNSLGTFVESGRITGNGGNVNDNTGGGGSVPGSPVISIQVSPLSGLTPLRVSFRGNAPQSDSPIVAVSWDFGDGSQPVQQSVAEHTYELSGTETETFVATFSATDSDGDVGRRTVLITVFSEESNDNSSGDGSVRIVVRKPGETADVGDTASVGERLELSVDTSQIIGTPQSVFWSLGDGATATSFIVLHTYGAAGTYPISTAVTSQLSSGDSVTFPASRLITITANENANGNVNVNDNVAPPPSGGGGGLSACGLGIVMPMLAMFGLALARRLRLF